MRRSVGCQGEGRVHEERLLARSFHPSHINYFVDTKKAHAQLTGASRIWGRPRRRASDKLPVALRSMRLNASNKDHWGKRGRRKGHAVSGDPSKGTVPLMAPAPSGPRSRRQSCICSPSPSGRWWSNHLTRPDDNNNVNLLCTQVWNSSFRAVCPEFKKLSVEGCGRGDAAAWLLPGLGSSRRIISPFAQFPEFSFLSNTEALSQNLSGLRVLTAAHWEPRTFGE